MTARRVEGDGSNHSMERYRPLGWPHGPVGQLMKTESPIAQRLDSSTTRYQQTLRILNDRIVAAQRPLRVLDAIHWDESIAAAFFARGGRDFPPVTSATYSHQRLHFDPTTKDDELRAITADIDRWLGRSDLAGAWLRRRCDEYREVVGLLMARGTDQFAPIARRIYQTDLTTAEHQAITALFTALSPGDPTRPENLRKIFGAEDAIAILSDRLRPMIPPNDAIRVKLCDRIVADAAAGCDYVKLRRQAMFSVLDLSLLEYHEGWVHLGTTLNGQAQPYLTALARGVPSTSATQEGLAVLCELLAGVCHTGRLARLWRRTQAVRMADTGADFLQVYRYFLQASDDPRDSYQQSVRVFRGSLPSGGGPFAKDLCYAIGLYRVTEWLGHTAAARRDAAIKLLFAGKTALADIGTLERLNDVGLVHLPKIVPPPFLDRRALGQRLAGIRRSHANLMTF